MPLHRVLSVVAGFIVASACQSASAQFVSGSDGSDGVFAPGSSQVIDLSLATTASWDTPSPVPGRGIYDPDLWVVVFKYSHVNIPSGVTISFTNHPSGAPVVWLVDNNATIQGTVSLSGQGGFDTGATFQFTTPGPGGFAGGAEAAGGLADGGGFGPGGGNTDSNGQRNYGNNSNLPLIGGSGGGGGGQVSTTRVGGAGGGAIMIAADGIVSIAGQIVTNGGNGQFSSGNYSAAGSGGAIRIIASTIQGGGSLSAAGGTQGISNSSGGNGKIRLEALTLSGFTGSSSPAYTAAAPGLVFPPSNAPTLRAASIGSAPVPVDPAAGVLTVDVAVPDANVVLEIEATNIPPGTTVEVRMVPAHGTPIVTTSTPLSGTFASSTAQAFLQLPDVPAEIQLRANW